MKIIVASKNPVKMDAVRLGFQAMFPEKACEISGVDVPSGVSDQPMTDAETLSGARNRAGNARTAAPDAELWFGIEGGIEDSPSGMHAFAWIVVQGTDLTGEARTGTFTLPGEVARLVREGVELGDADDIVFGRTNSKQQDGAVGLLTDGLIDRTAYYKHAVVLALIPFRKQDLYENNHPAP